jgi:amino acid transporter
MLFIKYKKNMYFKIKEIKMKKKIITVIAIALSILLIPDLVAATEKVDDVAKNLTGSVIAIGSLFGWIVAFAGGIFAFLGIVGLKKYADDARQNPLMKPLIMFIAGSLALGFTVFTGILTKTVVDEEQENEEVFEAKST